VIAVDAALTLFPTRTSVRRRVVGALTAVFFTRRPNSKKPIVSTWSACPSARDPLKGWPGYRQLTHQIGLRRFLVGVRIEAASAHKHSRAHV